MITVRDDTGENEIFLAPVDMFTVAADAAQYLWNSVHNATKIYGGEAVYLTPEDGAAGHGVRWESGPKDWAAAYIVSEGADSPEFTATSDDGMEVVFVDNH